jgi:hypothetical protein
MRRDGRGRGRGGFHAQDWTCPDCGNNVFGSKDSCGKCGKWRAPAPKPGDWTCICTEVNFASRVACRKCGKNKPGASAQVLAEAGIPAGVPPLANSRERVLNTFNPGDWICSCSEMNFGKRTHCRKCAMVRPPSGPNPELLLEIPRCSVCMDREGDYIIKTCLHLGYCQLCLAALDRCPHCRQPYTQADVGKTFNVSA